MTIMNAPEIIAAKAFAMEQHYMRDLPIHHSQKELRKTDTYTDFEVFIRPTTDFMAHLMSRGGWLQVISPRSPKRFSSGTKKPLTDTQKPYEHMGYLSLSKLYYNGTFFAPIISCNVLHEKLSTF